MPELYLGLTQPEMIMVAACRLEDRGQAPFSIESLIVEVWGLFSSTFGLRGFSDLHPDSNKVISTVVGEKGLARRGWLVKTGQKMYALTREGRRMAREAIGEPEQEEGTPRKQLPRDLERFVIGLFDSPAVRKFEENRKTELTFTDACHFWSITESMRGEQLDEKLNLARKHLTELERFFADCDAEMASGRVLTAGDIRVLDCIHRHMEDRFERHLTLLRGRGPDRGWQAHRQGRKQA